jgi:hypothetical protein
MVRTKQPKMAVCHPTLPAYAKGLCRKCYDAKRRTGNLPTSVSGEARAMAEQIAGQIPRADRRFEATKYVRTDRPAVANFVAGAIVKNFMDVGKAVEQIKPDLSHVQQAQTAHELENDPNIQAAVQSELKRLGLDEKSKAKYVQLLWKYAASELPENEKRQLTSLRLLGKAFLPEQVQVEAPEALPLKGLEEGLKRMGLGEDVVAALGPENVEVDLDDDTEGLGFDA